MMICNPISCWSDGAVFILDFMNGSLPSPITFTRASNAWYFDNTGTLQQAGSNVARFDYGSPAASSLQGMLIEKTSTNQALQCRDLTQSVWTKTSATTALDQTGIDGTANSATSFLSSAANATCFQTVTQAATQSVFSVYLKRITGSGTIKITQDGGTTYTTVTLTSNWQRFVCAAQTTVNPSFGIQIVTSGDKIAWDYAQFEATGSTYSSATSPIPTTTVSVTRAMDLPLISSIPFFNATAGTYVIEGIEEGVSTSSVWGDFNDGGNNNVIRISQGSSFSGNIKVAAVSKSSGGSLGGITPGSIYKLGLSYISGANLFAENGSVDTAGTFGASTLPSGITQFRFGSTASSTANLNGWIRRFRYWNTNLPQTKLQKVTT